MSNPTVLAGGFRRRLCCSVSAVVMTAIAGPMAFAEEAVEASGEGFFSMDEIVVSARKRDESLQDVPISILVTDGGTIERSGFKNLQDLRSRMPAVNISKGAAADSLSIRGLGSGTNPGFEQSVGTFVDGIYRGRARTSRNAFVDISRVEVLKGPQSTYFGYNTIAGALNIHTNAPTPGGEFEGFVSGLYQPTYNELDLQAAVTVPITEDLSVRAAGRVYDFDGTVKNAFNGDDLMGAEDYFGRVTAVWQATDDVDVTLRAEYGDSTSKLSVPFEWIDCPPNPAFYSGPPSPSCAGALTVPGFEAEADRVTSLDTDGYDKDKFFETSATINWQVADHTVTSVTGYSDYSTDQLYDLDGSSLPGFVTSESGGMPAFPAFGGEENTQFSQEFRLTSPGDQFLEYTAGLYYQHSELGVDRHLGFFFVPWFLTPLGFPPGTAVTHRLNSDKKKIPIRRICH